MLETVEAEMPIQASVSAGIPLISWPAGALSSLVITGASSTPTVEAAVRPPPPLLTDGVALVSPPAVPTLAHPGDRVTPEAVLGVAVTAGLAVDPVPPRGTFQLTVDTPGPGSTLTLPIHMMTLSGLPAVTLLSAVLAIATCWAGDIAVKTWKIKTFYF